MTNLKAYFDNGINPSVAVAVMGQAISFHYVWIPISFRSRKIAEKKNVDQET